MVCFVSFPQASLFPKDMSAFAFDPATEPEYLPNVEEDVENLASEEINDAGGMEDESQGGLSFFFD